MSYPPITPIPTETPLRGQPRKVFSKNGNDLLAALPLFQQQLNLAGAWIEGQLPNIENAATIAQNALAAMNYEGLYETLAGAQPKGISTYYNGEFWMLAEDAVDVTLVVPGIDEEWLSLKVKLFEVGDFLQSARTIDPSEGYLLADKTIYLQSEWPELYNTIGKIINFERASKVANPATLPTNSGRAVAFNPSGTLLAVGSVGSPNFLTVYSISGGTLTKIADPSPMPPAAVYDVAFNHDGTQLAVAHDTSPYVTLYTVSGETLSKDGGNPATLPTGGATSVAFNHNGTLLAVGHDNTPYITIYTVSGTTLTKLTNPSPLPPGDLTDVTFNSDGTLLAMAHSGSPYMTVYSVDGTTFTKLDAPAVIPASNGYSVSFNQDDTLLAVGHNGPPFLSLFTIDGSTVENAFASFSEAPSGSCLAVAFNPNGTLLAATQGNSPFTLVYAVSGAVLSKTQPPLTFLTDSALGVGFSADGTLLGFAHVGSPFFTVYDSQPYNPETEFVVPDAPQSLTTPLLTYIRAE